jgi:hypothetical protein
MSTKFVTIPGTTTKLPLMNLRGKDYLQGAYRLVWLNEVYKKFDVRTEFILVTDEQTIARTTLTIFDENGSVLKQATATKRETKKDFADHTEKAESSSLFRALSFLGIGTQFASGELEEGSRIVDSPLTSMGAPILVNDTNSTTAAVIASAESVATTATVTTVENTGEALPVPLKIPKFGKKRVEASMTSSGDLE